MKKKSTSGTTLVAVLAGCAMLLFAGCVGVVGFTCVGAKREAARQIATRADTGPLPDDPEPLSTELPPVAALVADAPPLPPSNGPACQPFDGERRNATFLDGRDFGSAKRLRGRVAIIHSLVTTPGHPFNVAEAARVRRAIISSQRTVVAEARMQHIDDLVLDVATWHVRTNSRLPALDVDERGILRAPVSNRIRQIGSEAVRVARNRAPLRTLVNDLRELGYTSVGMLLYFDEEGARDFAYPADGSFVREELEVGVVFARQHDERELAFVLTHEMLHLFGAPDIYRIEPRDARDDADIMNDLCDALDGARISEATGFSIGWRDRPPERRYRFGL